MIKVAITRRDELSYVYTVDLLTHRDTTQYKWTIKADCEPYRRYGWRWGSGNYYLG